MEQEKLYKGLKCENALAFAIRDAQSKYKSGYVIYGKDPYYHYLSNDDWRQFLTSMSQLHQAQYKDADGGELKEKNSRHGILPPKMASFASSSRFIYECSKSITGFCFEKQLPTRVGHTANLDGFLFADGFDVFIEAKCKEIYASHLSQSISIVYQDVYDYIHGKNNRFSYRKGEPTLGDNEHFNCTFLWDGNEICHFDIKQLICHFLGICANIIENDSNPNIRFIYLIFNPDKNTDFAYINTKIKDAKKNIIEIYNRTRKEIMSFGDFKWLFDTIMEYQSRLKPDKKLPICKFSFELLDQSQYIETFKIEY